MNTEYLSKVIDNNIQYASDNVAGNWQSIELKNYWEGYKRAFKEVRTMIDMIKEGYVVLPHELTK